MKTKNAKEIAKIDRRLDRLEAELATLHKRFNNSTPNSVPSTRNKYSSHIIHHSYLLFPHSFLSNKLFYTFANQHSLRLSPSAKYREISLREPRPSGYGEIGTIRSASS